LGAWDMTINYDSKKMIPIPIPIHQNISTFSLLADIMIKNTSVPANIQPLIHHAACQIDQNIDSSSLNNWVTITSDPANSLTSSFLLYSGSVWVVWQDELGSIIGHFLTIIMQNYFSDCSVPWINCYHQSNDPTVYWIQTGTATFNTGLFNPENAQNLINSDSNYNKHWGKFWNLSIT